MQRDGELIDTSEVKLSTELSSLIEPLSKHAHDVWLRRRVSEGWVYGLQQDGANKEHPSLVPYVELQECDKEYDRLAATEFLKAVLKLGYRIERP
jgi:ryanodine receptor 2